MKILFQAFRTLLSSSIHFLLYLSLSLIYIHTYKDTQIQGEHEHMCTHIILSCDPGDARLLLDCAADETGGPSFVLSRARPEKSCPDGSVHHVFSLVLVLQPAWSESLSLQCASSSVKVVVHVNKERKCNSWWFELESLRQTWGMRQITKTSPASQSALSSLGHTLFAVNNTCSVLINGLQPSLFY